MDRTRLEGIIQQYKTDAESVYNTWFVNNEERLKAFRSIRRGVEEVITEIKAGSFGNDLGVATLGRRSSGRDEDAADLLQCDRTSSDRSPRSSRSL
jgi:hypothetical protein